MPIECTNGECGDLKGSDDRVCDFLACPRRHEHPWFSYGFNGDFSNQR